MEIRRGKEALLVGFALSAMTLYILNSRKGKRPNHLHDTDNESDSISSNTSIDEQQQQGLSDDQLPSHILRERMKEKRRRSKLALLSMKSPLYDNIDMLDPHGTLLCKVSARKAKWYISKELAEWVKGEGDDQNDCLQLRFEPKKGHDDNKHESRDKNDEVQDGDTTALYSKAMKKNICVSCGEAQNLVRYYIVPYAYRVLMPIEYKSHMSHDIVILCCYCNMHCDKAKQKRIEELEDIFKPPGGYRPQFENDQSLYKVRSAALALKNWAHKIPKEKIREHERTVRSYLQTHEGNLADNIGDDGREQDLNNGNGTTLSANELQKAIDVKYRVENLSFVSSYQVVVSEIVKSGEKCVSDFVREWRQHFVDTMQPQFMPVGWSVDNSVSC